MGEGHDDLAGASNDAPEQGAGVNNLAPGKSATDEIAHPPSAGLVHLISSHEVVETWSLTSRYTAECGALMWASTPQNAGCPNECECWPTYCPACLEAIEHNREAGRSAPAFEFGTRVSNR